ncbi:thioredoxin family protein [Urechidicola croceus]|uniref:Thioredoxin family protein n=1 Tax=Urechidicola croceus TaxID=1850246 RepID=A0A1D8P7C3_9FLAO|nr:thioredoxin fold domain-containing protein [Urechidicola croceus]AOW20456.1 thioredoxin family protein [Urechidicola croceus]
MKNYIFVFILLLTTKGVNAQKINWITLEKAIELQKKEPRKIFMEVYTDWCGNCKLLDKNTFSNLDVINFINENFYAVKFNAEGNSIINYKGNLFTNPQYQKTGKKKISNHQFTNYMGIQSYPTLVFLDENANFIIPIKGYQTVHQLEMYLKIFSNNEQHYMQTDEKFIQYQKSFKPKFEI